MRVDKKTVDGALTCEKIVEASTLAKARNDASENRTPLFKANHSVNGRNGRCSHELARSNAALLALEGGSPESFRFGFPLLRAAIFSHLAVLAADPLLLKMT